eukprot:scaffold21420_cov51-Phaeocystis_antarctica.AAC.1
MARVLPVRLVAYVADRVDALHARGARAVHDHAAVAAQRHLVRVRVRARVRVRVRASRRHLLLDGVWRGDN